MPSSKSRTTPTKTSKSSTSSSKPASRSPAPTVKEQERAFHAKLDFEERAQAANYLSKVHGEVDRELAGAAKRSLLQVEGEGLTEMESGEGGAGFLAARENFTNPLSPREGGGGS